MVSQTNVFNSLGVKTKWKKSHHPNKCKAYNKNKNNYRNHKSDSFFNFFSLSIWLLYWIFDQIVFNVSDITCARLNNTIYLVLVVRFRPKINLFFYLQFVYRKCCFDSDCSVFIYVYVCVCALRMDLYDRANSMCTSIRADICDHNEIVYYVYAKKERAKILWFV